MWRSVDLRQVHRSSRSPRLTDDKRTLASAHELIGMSEKADTKDPAHQKPGNQANMDQSQEEFIEPESAHPNRDKEHGEEMRQVKRTSESTT